MQEELVQHQEGILEEVPIDIIIQICTVTGEHMEEVHLQCLSKLKADVSRW